jgi:tetratricopeptide (TPR) repeat protein
MDSGHLSITLDSGISSWGSHGLGRFRLSASDDPAAFERQQKRVAVLKLSDPWAKLAAAYHVIGDQAARDQLLRRHPAATAGIGHLYALQQDWERAIAQYTRAITQGTKDARIFAARAEALEKLEKWELAAADWGNADLYASDKRVRYGSPSSFPALEHRAHIHGRLKQFDKQVLDYTELMKPERLGNNPWMFVGRGEAYGQLHQWDKARPDIDQAIRFSTPAERATFQFVRARHFAAQGRWKEAADDTKLSYQKPTDAIKEWWALRDASLIYAIAGDAENYRKAVADCYAKQATGNPNPDECRWTVLTMLLLPGMITKENRPRLLELAGKADAFWQPRLTAAIYFRSGDDKKAAELFDANGGGAQFFFLGAMTHHKRGNPARAKQLLEEGNSWVREQCAKDPGEGVPRPHYWQDWATIVALQSEALELILGPGIAGAPRNLAIQGQTARAAQAYAKALADAPDQKTKAQIMDELAQFGDVLTAFDVLNNDWKNVAARYSRQTELDAKPESWNWMVAPTLWAYAGETGRHRESCQKMYQRYRNSTVPNDTERCLKMMLLVESGPELPSDAARRFVASIDDAKGEDLAWFRATAALLDCRNGNYSEAHKRLDEALALEKQVPNPLIKSMALAVRSLVYANQKELANARKSLDQLKQVMSHDLKMSWKADGLLDGRTILNGTTIEHDKLIPEIIRREAEKLVQSAAASPR